MLTYTELSELMKDAYPDVELDEPTEEDWDQHTLASLKDLDMDSFASTPEREI